MNSDRTEPLRTRAEPAPIAYPQGADRDARPAAIVFWVTIASVGLFLLQNILTSPEALTARFSVDDSFYYFQMGWQSAQSGFVTFDGLHGANGVHFLWFGIVYGLALVSPDKIFLLHAIYLVAAALVLLTYGLIWRAGTLLDDRDRYLTALFALIWTIVLARKSHQMFVGMESTLHMTALWGCFVAYLGFMAAIDGSERARSRAFLLFSISLVLIAWARLDSALFSAGLFIWALHQYWINIRDNNRQFIATILPSILVICVGASIQFYFYLATAGTFMPISGLIKTAAPHETTAEMFRSFASTLFPFGGIALTHATWFLLFGIAIFCLLLWYVIRRAVAATDPRERRVCQFAVILGLGAIVFAALLCRHHNVFSRWYLGPVYLFYILGSAQFLHNALKSVDLRQARQNVLRLSLAVMLFVTGILGLSNSYVSDPLYLSRYRFALDLRNLTEPDATLAAFNAGQLAYFSDRRLINLDGLVNDKRYMETILGNPSALQSYLRERGVDYLADYDFYWANDVVDRMTDVVASRPTENFLGQILTLRRIRPE